MMTAARNPTRQQRLLLGYFRLFVSSGGSIGATSASSSATTLPQALTRSPPWDAAALAGSESILVCVCVAAVHLYLPAASRSHYYDRGRGGRSLVADPHSQGRCRISCQCYGDMISLSLPNVLPCPRIHTPTIGGAAHLIATRSSTTDIISDGNGKHLPRRPAFCGHPVTAPSGELGKCSLNNNDRRGCRYFSWAIGRPAGLAAAAASARNVHARTRRARACTRARFNFLRSNGAR